MKLICIPATVNHLKYVDYTLKLLSGYFPNDNFIIVTPEPVAFKYLESNVVVVKNDIEYLDVTQEYVREALCEKKKVLYKWYYQQLLKYSIIAKSQKYSDVLIMDADTIPLSNFIVNIEAINLNTTEYHKPYFDLLKSHFPDQKLLTKSAIVNCMWFNVSLFNEMIQSLEDNGSRKWYQVIIDDIGKLNESNKFSEYETYANYKFNKTNAKQVVLKIFRRADLFNDYYSFEEIIKIAGLFKFDLISFEDNHSSSLLKKVVVFILVIYVKIKLLLNNKL